MSLSASSGVKSSSSRMRDWVMLFQLDTYWLPEMFLESKNPHVLILQVTVDHFDNLVQILASTQEYN